MATPTAFYLVPVNAAERPTPYPPRILKRHIYSDPAVFEHIDLHSINEARTNYRTFRDLMWNLVFSQSYNDLEKSRAIFRWLTTKNLYTIVFDSQMPGSPEQTIVAFKDGKTTYAKIFECLATYAGLHCVTINGWVKGVDCKPGEPITQSPSNHSWNAVYIDGSWQLVDCHWATRYIQSDRIASSLVYEYDDFYFFTEPAMLVYSHCPLDPTWQLVHPVRSKTEYEEYPLVKSFFFTTGLQFLQQNRGILFTKRGIVTVTLGFTQPTAFTFKLAYGESGVDALQNVPLKRYVIQETTDNRVTFYFRSPREGTYYITIFAQQLSGNYIRVDNLYKAACEYKVICDRAASEIRPFPLCVDLNWGVGTPVSQYGLVPSHKMALLAAPNGRADVSFVMTRYVRLHAKLIREGMSESMLARSVTVGEQEDSTVYVSVNLPQVGEYGLEVYASEPQRDGDTYTHICQFLVAFTDRNFAALYGQVFDRSDLAHGMQADPLLYTGPTSQYTTMSRQNGSMRNPPVQGSVRPGSRNDSQRPNRPGSGSRSGRHYHSMRTDQENRRTQQQQPSQDSMKRTHSGPAGNVGPGGYGQAGYGPGGYGPGGYGPGGYHGPNSGNNGPNGNGLVEVVRRPHSHDPPTRDGTLERGSSRRKNVPTPTDRSPKTKTEYVYVTEIKEMQPAPVPKKRPDNQRAAGPLEIVYVTNVTQKQQDNNKAGPIDPRSPVEVVYVKKGKSGRDDSSSQSSSSHDGKDDRSPVLSPKVIPSSPVRPPRQQDQLKHTEELRAPPPESFRPVPIQDMKDAPGPTPPGAPNTPFKDRSIFRNVDLHAVEVSKEEFRSFRDLVWHLIYERNITDELDKARAIFLWLCSKDLTRLTFDTIKKGSPEEILMNLARSRTTYAVVYEILCSYAGLHCKTISGYAKGAEYKPGMRFTGELGQHSWNAVLVNRYWRLVDCHWAARRLVGKKITPENVRYELDEYYFMPDTHQLIFTHFPDNSDWQLLDHPISLTEFENLVPVKSSFFKYGLQVVDYREAVIHAQDEITLRVACPTGKAKTLSFTYTMTFENGSEDFNGLKLNQYGMHEMVDDVSYFTVRPPSKGIFRLIIYAKDSSGDHEMTRDGVYGAVCEYAIICDTNPGNVAPFPPCINTSYGPGDSVAKYQLKPLQQGSVFCTTDGILEVRFNVPHHLRFSTKLRTSGRDGKISLDDCVMQRVIGDIATFTVSAPGPGEYGLEIYANDPELDGTSLYHVYQYLVICNERVSSNSKHRPSLPPGYLGPQQLFHKYGLKCASHDDPYITTDTGDLQITFVMSTPIRMTSQLLMATGNEDRECYENVLQQCRGTTQVSFLVRLPKTGVYKFQIYGLPLSDANDNLPSIYNCLIEFNGSDPTCAVSPFPRQFGQWKDGCYLYEPICAHIQQRSVGDGRISDNIYFKVDVPRANAVAVVVGDDWTQLETRGGTSVWEGDVNMAEFWGRESKVFVCANYGSVSSSYHTLLEYVM